MKYSKETKLNSEKNFEFLQKIKENQNNAKKQIGNGNVRIAEIHLETKKITNNDDSYVFCKNPDGVDNSFIMKKKTEKKENHNKIELNFNKYNEIIQK